MDQQRVGPRLHQVKWTTAETARRERSAASPFHSRRKTSPRPRKRKAGLRQGNDPSSARAVRYKLNAAASTASGRRSRAAVPRAEEPGWERAAQQGRSPGPSRRGGRGPRRRRRRGPAVQRTARDAGEEVAGGGEAARAEHELGNSLRAPGGGERPDHARGRPPRPPRRRRRGAARRRRRGGRLGGVDRAPGRGPRRGTARPGRRARPPRAATGRRFRGRAPGRATRRSRSRPPGRARTPAAREAARPPGPGPRGRPPTAPSTALPEGHGAARTARRP